MANHIIENEYAKYWIEKDILYAVYKNGVSLDEAAAIKDVADRHSLQDGKSFLFFCDVRGIKSINKEARNYFASEGIVLVKATAFLINSPLNLTLSNFFIKTNNPPVMIEIFTERDDALEFLNNYSPT